MELEKQQQARSHGGETIHANMEDFAMPFEHKVMSELETTTGGRPCHATKTGCTRSPSSSASAGGVRKTTLKKRTSDASEKGVSQRSLLHEFEKADDRMDEEELLEDKDPQVTSMVGRSLGTHREEDGPHRREDGDPLCQTRCEDGLAGAADASGGGQE